LFTKPFNKKAASIVKVGSLKKWVGRDYSEGYTTKGLNALKEVAKQFVFKSQLKASNLVRVNTGGNNKAQVLFFLA
jgi:hypothetical protein